MEKRSLTIRSNNNNDMKRATSAQLNTIEIETNDNGFTVWMIGVDKKGKPIKRWVVDASCIKEDGRIELASGTGEYSVVNISDDTLQIFSN